MYSARVVDCLQSNLACGYDKTPNLSSPTLCESIINMNAAQIKIKLTRFAMCVMQIYAVDLFKDGRRRFKNEPTYVLYWRILTTSLSQGIVTFRLPLFVVVILWRTIAVHGVRLSKKEPQKLKPKEQPMPKSNDNPAMNVRSCLQIEQISSQSSREEGNWRFVLANYPMKELVREHAERFAMLKSYSKSRRQPMNTLIPHTELVLFPRTEVCCVDKTIKCRSG